MRYDILGAIAGGILIGAVGVGVLMIPYMSNSCFDYKAQVQDNAKFANEVGWQLRYSGTPSDATGVIPELPSPDGLAKISAMLGCDGFVNVSSGYVLFKPESQYAGSIVPGTGSSVFVVKDGRIGAIPKLYCKLTKKCK